MFASEDVRNILLGSDGSRVLRSIADLQARKRLDRTDLVLEMFHDLVREAFTEATVASWGQKYYGSACTALWKYICYNFRPNPETPLTNELDKRQRTRSTLITRCYSSRRVQASPGSSMSLRRRSFLFLSASVTCRLYSHSVIGYPPADVDVRTYLTDRNTRIATYARCWAFMQALFRHTATVLKQDEFETLDYSETVALFRVKMTEIAKRNKTKRIESRHLSPPKDHASEGSLAAGAEDAQNVEPKEQDAQSVDSKLLQSLMEAWKELDKSSHQLLYLLHLPLHDRKIFPVRTSESGRHVSSGLHPHAQTDPPFCDTGMDLLAINEDKKVNLLGGYRLQDVVTDQFMTSFGRPLCVTNTFCSFPAVLIISRFGLMYRRGDQSVRDGLLQFAMQKLTNHHAGVPVEIDMEQATACLGFRLPFEFLSTTDISQDMEFKQVEGHLRICLKPHSESESMVTISPSEPFVSEAAAALLRTTKWKGGTKKGCGEFVALLLLTLARDRAANPRTFLFSDFMRHLLATRKSQGRSLSTMTQEFPKAMMHFNHFIRPHQQKIIHRDMLLLLMARGAGVLCAPNTRKIDIILPFLVDGDTIKPTNVGAILCQVKNDKSYTDTPEPELFKDMIHIRLGFFLHGASGSSNQGLHGLGVGQVCRRHSSP
ncbi:hypothetical protein IMY05_C4393000400 [Salix suchowensis]|nr:hypothetical protein IMY05_C4393000400 [Salix suchowensis]